MAGWRGSRFYRRATRLSPGSSDRWLQFIDGSVLRIPDDEALADAIYAGCYEPCELKLLSRLIDAGDLACDVGANFGLFTFAMASLVGRNGTVLSWEPEPAAFERLVKSVQHAALGQVTCFPYALGRQQGSAVLQRRSGNSFLASLRTRADLDDSTRCEVEVHALDEWTGGVVAANGIALLKVDTEGWEQDVLAGATQLLRHRSVRGMIIEVSPNFGSIDYLSDLLSPAGGMAGYAIETRRRLLRDPVALRPLAADAAMKRTRQFNLLVLREDALQRVADLVTV